MVCTVCFLSWWKILDQGILNFKLIELVLDNLIAYCFVKHVWYAPWKCFPMQLEFWACPYILDQLDCFVRHIWLALSIFFRDGNFLLEAVGILSLSNYSCIIGLQIVLFGTHGLHCLFFFHDGNFLLRQLEFWACPNTLDKLDCFVRHVWFSLSVFFRDRKFLLEAFRILSLFNYSRQLYCRLFR